MVTGIPVAASGSGHARKNKRKFEAVVHARESTHKVRKSASQVVFSRMQLTLHATRETPHGASPLVQAMSARSVKTLRAPYRHSRDARVNGYA